jgi:hypothetical protein
MNKAVNVVESNDEKSGTEQNFQGMTIKEIAELCGVKGDHTIRNWINKEVFLSENFTLRNAVKEKLEQGSPENPSHFTLEETLVIIGEGGGNKVLASLLAENAANKNTLVKGRYAARHYAEHIGPAAQAAGKTHDLMLKYRDADNISKQDAAKLFEYAAALRRYFNDTTTVTDALVIRNTALEQKLLRTCHRLNISQDDVPAYKSWDKGEWPDFPELPVPSPALLTES